MATSDIRLVDFHSHCLPAIDDGARDVSTACAMLKMVAEQGAKAVVATPHFYAGHHTIEEFLQKRQKAYATLMATKETLPPILLGAEVLLREGVSRMDLRPLCLEGTNILLVELPFMPPPGWLTEELEEIAYTQKLTIMFAHLDRYLPWYSGEVVERLLELPDVIVQLNAEMFADRRAFRDLRNWLPCCERMVLGSDMHNVEDRAPMLNRAVRVMSRHRVGRRWLEWIEETTRGIE